MKHKKQIYENISKTTTKKPNTMKHNAQKYETITTTMKQYGQIRKHKKQLLNNMANHENKHKKNNGNTYEHI